MATVSALAVTIRLPIVAFLAQWRISPQRMNPSRLVSPPKSAVGLYLPHLPIHNEPVGRPRAILVTGSSGRTSCSPHYRTMRSRALSVAQPYEVFLTFAVHNRHEILRYSWAVDLKPARSRTTPFVRGAISLDEDPPSPLSASRP